MTHRAGRLLTAVDRAAGGLAADLFLYAASTAFAFLTAATSSLQPHRAWGTIAGWGYAAAALIVIGQLLIRRATGAPAPPSSGSRRLTAYGWEGWAGSGARAALSWLTWVAACLLPLVVEAAQRAGGRIDRAQDEVLVVERMGARLLHSGTPYLGRDAIATLPADERLGAYSPYQPGMAIFGLPRALFGSFWWTDARVWFAAVTAAALVGAVLLLRPSGARLPAEPPTAGASGRRRRPAQEPPSPTVAVWVPGTQKPTVPAGARIRAIQAVTVLPICALTLATGGDDLPVLALCLLALALAAVDRFGWAGAAVGAAAAGKLFAFPVVAVLAALALAAGRGRRLLPAAVGLPIAVLIPPFLVDQAAFVENVIRFPLGHGVVQSPAQSPFPGFLLAQTVPGGRYLAAALLVAVAATITVRLALRHPRTAADAAVTCGWGLLAAILLMPTTRFGYLLYPAAFLLWTPALRIGAAHSKPTAAAATPGEPALYRR